MASKQFSKVTTQCVQGGGWKKLVLPKVAPGLTSWPAPADQPAVGVRADFVREVIVKEEVTRKDEATQQDVVTFEDVIYNEFKVQPNHGKISSFFKNWRDANGGTHAVMATMLVKKGGEKADVEKAWDDVAKVVKGA